MLRARRDLGRDVTATQALGGRGNALDVGDEAAERLAELADFVAAAMLHALVHVTERDANGRRAQLLERKRDAPRDEDAEPKREHHRERRGDGNVARRARLRGGAVAGKLLGFIGLQLE